MGRRIHARVRATCGRGKLGEGNHLLRSHIPEQLEEIQVWPWNLEPVAALASTRLCQCPRFPPVLLL